MSEKVALVVNFIAAFLTGFILAYARCWRLALAMSSILPCIGFTGAIMNKFVSKYMQSVPSPFSPSFPHTLHRLSLKHVAAGGTLAEEVISTIRTAHAFGTQKTLSSLYDVHVQQAHVVDAKSATFHGAGLAVFFFIIYSAYALGTHFPSSTYFVTNSLLAFQFGTTLINEGHGKLQTLTILNLISSCFFSKSNCR